jgi:hypothetical protein
MIRDDPVKWPQVTLAVIAGLGSLAVCSGAVAVIVLLFIASIDFGGWIGSSLNPALFLVGVLAAVVVAWASLSLPSLALGAGGGHLLKTTLLSGLGFCAFVFGSFLTLAMPPFLAPLIPLMGLVGTPAVGSLVAVREVGQIGARALRASLIAALAIYGASLLAYWSIFGEDGASGPSILGPLIVAATSWPVLPGIVAMLRSS